MVSAAVTPTSGRLGPGTAASAASGTSPTSSPRVTVHPEAAAPCPVGIPVLFGAQAEGDSLPRTG